MEPVQGSEFEMVERQLLEMLHDISLDGLLGENTPALKCWGYPPSWGAGGAC
jgi:hypothetical protein